MPRIHNQPGRPHYPAREIGKSEPLDEVTEMPRIDNQLGRPHYPAREIGKSEPQEEGRVVSMCHGLPINSAAHTTPYRLAIVAGGKMDQFADSTNRKLQIANLKSPDGTMAQSQVPYCKGKAADLQNRSALHRLLRRVYPYRSAQHGLSRRVYPSTDGPNGGVKPPQHQLAPPHHARAAWGYSGSVYNGRLGWLIRNKGISS